MNEGDLLPNSRLRVGYFIKNNEKSGICMSQLTRQQLYDKIKETSKDEYILSEMQRLGYWKEDAQPTLAASLIKRRGDLQRQINALSSQITDPKAALKAIHQER